MNLTTWLLAGIGTLLFLYGVIKTPPSRRPTTTEIVKLTEDRKQYLPQLKKLIHDYINRVEFLAKNTDKLYDLKLLKETYMANRIWERTQSSYEDKISLLALLYYRIYVDNIVFRQVQDEDPKLFKLNQQIDSYGANVKDKKVKNYVKGFKIGSHMAYSYFIFNKLVTNNFDKTPLVIRFYLNQKRKMQDKFRRHQNNINLRIDELLEGAEDEL